jgi:hypothetical protein
MSKEGPGVGDTAPVQRETHGAVAVIRLNRPDRLNAVDDEMIEAIRTAFRGVREDAAIRSAVLIGNGRCFMVGADLSVFHNELANASRTAARLIDGFHGMLREIRILPKPVIAAIAGSVAGGGVGLALACDLAVIAEECAVALGLFETGDRPGCRHHVVAHTRGRGAARLRADVPEHAGVRPGSPGTWTGRPDRAGLKACRAGDRHGAASGRGGTDGNRQHQVARRDRRLLRL